METQKQIIKKHLIREKSITSWQAIQKYRITRLAAIIHRLRNEGMNITSIHRFNGEKQFTEYEI